jgi:Cytochrome c oxidase assembly protein PET191
MAGEPKAACKDEARELLLCLQTTECAKGGKEPLQCLGDPSAATCQVFERFGGLGGGGWGIHGVEDSGVGVREDEGAVERRYWGGMISCVFRVGRVQKFRYAYTMCRRSQLDMRSRIRGSKFTSSNS